MSNFLYKDNKKLILQCLLVGLLIIAGLWVPRLNIVALFAAIVCIWTLDKEDILCFTSFLVSFSPIFKITLGGFTFFNVIIIVDVLRGLILSKFCLKKNTSIPLIILTFYTLATGFKNGILDVFTFLCYLFLVELLYSQETTSMHKLVTFTTLGIITTSGVSLLKSNFPRLVQIMNEATIRLSAGNYYYRFAGIETNPNYYTLLLSVCIAAFLVLLIEGQNKKIDYLYVGTLIFFGMLTVSQSFIVTLAICMIIVILTIGGRGNRRAPATIIALIIISTIAFVVLGDDVVNTIKFRLERVSSADSLAEVTTGRTDLALYYLKYILNNTWNLLFGRGIGASNLPMGASHNFYIDILYHLGLVGGFIYLVYLYRAYFGHEKNRTKVSIYRYMPLLCFGLRAFAINLIARENLIFSLMICSLVLFDDGCSRAEKN